MIKCLLIYLWIYIGLFYMIEAGDDDEHVHIKLHMSGGQRKRAQIQQHTNSHHKKRHTSSTPHHHQHHHHQQQLQQQLTHPLPPPVATTTTNLYHESPHNYLTGITETSSSSLLPQNHVFHPSHTEKFLSSSPLNLHESGQLLNMEEDVFAQGDVGGEAVASVDTDAGEHMTIPSYMTKNFALFPQPTATYETEIIPHNSEGFNVVSDGLHGLQYMEEDNEITPPAGRGKGSLESIILAGHLENYQRHNPSAAAAASLSSTSSSSAKSIKNEQLLQRFLQQQHNEKPEVISAAAYKSAKLRANKHKAEKDYHSEDDMTEAMMYATSAIGTKHNTVQSFNRPAEDDAANTGSIKALTVDDIWSQLQQQYLSKYSPQAQPLTSADSDELPVTATTTPTKTQSKRKRNTKRQRHSKPVTTTSYSTSWPAKPLSYVGNNNHGKFHLQSIRTQQQFYDDTHFPLPSASAYGSTSLSTHRGTDFFPKRPFSKQTTHNDEDDTAETDDETAVEFGEDEDEDDDDDFDVYGDESFEETVYQRGKKFPGHTTYGHQSHTKNPFNHHDLYAAYSTPVTATVATNLQPSTYHPNFLSSTLPSFTSSSSTANTFLPTLSHPPTSYQWRTQQTYPASYQTYHLQHQQQQQPLQWTAEEQYAQQQSSAAVRLPKATIIQTPSAITSLKLSPTQSNEFSVSSSTSSSAKTTGQTPVRYKKRKNRTKPKRNRIVVI